MINNDVFLKTKRNLIKINIAVVSSFLILFSVAIYGYFKNLTYTNVDMYLKEEFSYIGAQLTKNHFIVPSSLDPTNMIYIYKDNKIKYFTPNGYFKDSIPYEKSDNLGFSTYKNNEFTFRELKFNIYEYTIQIIRNIDSEMNLLRQLMLVFLAGVVLAIIVTYFIALYLTKKALIPIENTWSNQIKFTQDASHEIRTPITIISSKMERLLKNPESTINDEIDTIADAMRETRRLKKMVNDLLDLTKEDSIISLSLSEVNIKKMIENICKDYIEIAEIQGKNFAYKFHINQEYIIIDGNKLRQLILIFIDNAFKYTKENDDILITVKEKDNNIVISVQDSGIGIDSKEINLIFDRFFRSQNVRNKDIDGSGIGLSIAKMIIINLKGRIEVTSNINKGSKFDITIPKKIKKI